MKNLPQKAISVILITMILISVIPVTISMAAYNYTPSAAAAYALTYAYNYNSNYTSYKGKGGDCANFVSQCLYNGGITKTSKWYPDSYQWINCGGLKTFLCDTLGCTYISQPSASQISIGDVMYYNNGSHVCIVSTIENGTPKVCGHTTDTKNGSYKQGFSVYGVIKIQSSTSHTVDTSYGTNFTSYPKAKITASNIFDANHNQISSTCWIGTSDKCTIHEVYTDGCCKVTYPLDSGGSKTVYSKISLFNTHTHSYGKNYEAAHPHRYYMKCSCGDYYYTGENKYLATCSSCHTHSYTGSKVYESAHPHRISQRCTEYSSCGGFIWLDEYYYCSDCSQCQSDFGARIKASVSSITLDLNGSNTKTITVTAYGNIPSSYRFKYNRSNTSTISCSWTNKWNGNSIALTIKGKNCGSANLTLSIYESTTGNDNILHQIVIPVTVTCSHSYNSGTVTTAPTCKSTGIKTYT